MIRCALAVGLVLVALGVVTAPASRAASEEAVGVLVRIDTAGDKDSFTVDGTSYGDNLVELLHQFGARNQVHGNAWDTRLVAVVFSPQTPLSTLLTIGGMAGKEGFNHLRFLLTTAGDHPGLAEIMFGTHFVVSTSSKAGVRLLAGQDGAGELLTGLVQIEKRGKRYVHIVDGRACCEREFLPELMAALRGVREKQRAQSDDQGLTVLLSTPVPLSKASALDIIAREIGFGQIRYFWRDHHDESAQEILRGQEFSLVASDNGVMRLVPR